MQDATDERSFDPARPHCYSSVEHPRPMFRIAFSNRYEVLQQKLLDRLATPAADPFVADEVIVPSAAIRRDIELAAATRFGVCANTRFAFLAQWLWRQIARVVPVGEHSPFAPDVLAWRIYALLGDATLVSAQAPLARYLRDGDARDRFDLAVRIASLFDQYTVYRPAWLEAWAGGRTLDLGPDAAADQRWQAALWQRIAAATEAGARHPSVAYFAELETLGPDAAKRAGLPARLHVFAPPTLAPLHLDLMRRLSRWIDIDLYAQNPSQEYWFDVVEPKRLSWLRARGQAAHHETGNTLLAAWGRQTQQFVDLLFDGESVPVEEDSEFVAADRPRLLAFVQDAILDLVALPRGSVPPAADDRSVEVHVCHSLTREIEVLQDRLLGLFAGDNSLRPADILVVTPDLVSAAPLIDAVFGTVPRERHMPYAITGLPAVRNNSAAAALLSVLDLATSRVTATGVVDVLQQPLVARRFALDDAGLEIVRRWIRDAGIRWGLDAAHRAGFGVPATAEHTFADGIDRLFLGYALPAADTLFAGQLPAGDAEGTDAAALGGLYAFIREIGRLHARAASPKSIARWRDALGDVVASFFAAQRDEVDELRDVDAAITRLCDAIGRGGAVESLPFAVVRAALEPAFDDPARGGVPSGSVTFAPMTSLRGLPYRVVCAIGMNDRAWPTSLRPLEFDLMADKPARGDRQRRIDERNVFLDLVLAARDVLHVSYTGHGERDNAELPPSVLVAELVDSLLRARPDETSGDAARERLIVRHPLHPFTATAFDTGGDRRLRSFDADVCAAVRAAELARHGRSSVASHTIAGDNEIDQDEGNDVEAPAPSFFALPLASPGPEWRDVTLPALQRFFANPSRYLLAQRLRLVLPQRYAEIDDDEPFVAGYDERKALADRLAPLILAGCAPELLAALARAGREYPPGRLGETELEFELEQVNAFERRWRDATRAPLLPPFAGSLAFELDGEPWRLSATFDDLRASGTVRFRYTDTSAHDRVAEWLAHLALNALRPAGVEPHSEWLARDGGFRLPPLDAGDAQDTLAGLLRLYRAGLQAPLHFFPRSSWAYVDEGMSEARKKWMSFDRRFGEWRDAAYRLALRGVEEPLDDDFFATADAVFGPFQRVVTLPGGAP